MRDLREDPSAEASQPTSTKRTMPKEHREAVRAEKRPVALRLHAVEIEGEVPFHDIDMQRVVWHGHYFKYFDRARAALWRHCGLVSPTDPTGRTIFRIVETSCRHLASLRYPDRFRSLAWFESTGELLRVGFEILGRDDGRCYARGHSVFELAGSDRELPANVAAALRRLRDTPRSVA